MRHAERTSKCQFFVLFHLAEKYMIKKLSKYLGGKAKNLVSSACLAIISLCSQ